MHGKNISILFIALLLCFIGQAAIQQTEQVVFRGKVLDGLGWPVAGTKVIAYEMLSDGIAGNILLRPVGEKTTAEDGAFTFASIPKPEREVFLGCEIVAVKPDLALGWTEWTMREDARSDIQLGTPEKLGGVIVDEEGKPVTGAEVRANLTRTVKTADGKEKKIWLPGIEPLQELGIKADSQGRFYFKNLPAEVGVDLLVTAAGRATIYTYKLEPREPAFKAGQTDIKITLPAEARIEGRILDPDTGEGIAGTQFAVVATSSGLFYYRFVHTTNDDGTFSVGGLQTDRYLFRNGGFPHTYVETESGRTTNIMVRADRLSRPRGITGIVRDPKGKPLPNVVVSTYPPVAEEIITDAKGAFTLRTRRARRPNDKPTYLFVRHRDHNLAAAVELDESAKTLDITLDSGFILAGMVVDTNSKAIANSELSLLLWIANQVSVSSDVIEIDDEGYFEIRAIPPGHKYSVRASAEGYGRRDAWIDTGVATNEHIELEPLVLLVANLSVSGIVVDEFDQPVSGVGISISGNGQPSRGSLTDVKGQFTIENVCSGPIRIYAYKDTPRRLHGRTEAEGGATDIKIVVAELDERGKRVPKQPPSLIGKSLPELKRLGIHLSEANLKGKRILVCLWDMNQRPSRNCLLQLAKKAEELKRKDATIIAIQASGVEKSELDTWVKKNRIPFPVGMIQGEETKAHFAWGIRSLPWLILTDRGHIVRAEGFALSELSDKIDKVRDNTD